MASSATNYPSSATSSASPSTPSTGTGAGAAPASSSTTSTSSTPSGSPSSVSVGEDLLSPGNERSRSQDPDRAAAHAEDMEPAGTEALDRWVERLHAGIDRLAEAAAPRLQRLQSGMSATRGTLRRQARLVREDGEEWAESLRCTVREHPVTAVAVAAAFGLLLARLSR